MDEGNDNHTFGLSLLENGIDFILKGIDDLFDEDSVLREYVHPPEVSPRSYKYGVLHLFSGFLLLLKERLSRHMEELIYTGKISDIRQKLRANRTPNTVDFDEALERLEIGPRVVFPDSELQVILRMRRFRNDLEHFRVAVNKYELWANISAFLAIIDRFLTQELHINIEDQAESLELGWKIQIIEAVWQRAEAQRVAEWRADAERRAAAFQENRAEILDSLHHTYRIEHGAIALFIECPECYQETLIIYGEYEGVCSNEECGAIYPIKTCDGCGETMTGFRWEYDLCEACRIRIALE